MNARLPFLTTIIAFLAIVLGGMVVGLNAGFACPDWPLCHGSFIPPLNVTGIVEYMHRLSIPLLSCFMILTWIEAWRKRRTIHRWVPILAVSSFVCLVLQITLGAVIVVFVMPGSFTTIDVAVAMTLFCIYTAWTVVCRKPTLSPKQETVALRKSSWFMTGIVYAQVVFGAFFRHSGAGEAFFGQSGYLASHHETDIPSKALSTGLLVAHILLAILVTGCAMWLYIQAKRYRAFINESLILLLLVVVQMLLGFASLASYLEFWVTTAHFAVSALMLSSSVWISISMKSATNAQELYSVKYALND